MKTGCHKPLVNVDRGLDLGTPAGSEWPFHNGGSGASRAAHAAAGAARPFPAPVGLAMAMHVHARIRPWLYFSWSGQHFERGAFGSAGGGRRAAALSGAHAL